MKMKLVVRQIYWNQNNSFFYIINWCGYLLVALTSSWIPKEVRLLIGLVFFWDSLKLLICTHKWLHFVSLSRDSSLAHLLVMPSCCSRLEVGSLFCILANKRGSFSKGGTHLRGVTDFRISCALISFNFPYESTDRMSSMLTWNQRTFFLKKVKWGVCNKLSKNLI